MTRSPFTHEDPAVLPLDRVSVFFDGQYSDPRLHHPEGVAVAADGSVWCGNAEGDIVRIDPRTGAAERVATTGGFTLGLAFEGDANLYVCDQKSAAVWRLHLSDRSLTRFTAPGIRIPNYPVVDPHRNCLYVSDSFGAGAAGPGVWRYDLSSGEGELWWREPMQFANGMALSEDGRTLYVVETFGRKVSRIEIGPDGLPAGIGVAAENLPGLPDGIALDERGDLFVSCYEPSRILRIDRSGRLDVYVEDPEAHLLCHPTNIAFDGKTLYAANLGRWHIASIETDTSAPPLAAMVGIHMKKGASS
jgi:Gluconolactonase